MPRARDNSCNALLRPHLVLCVYPFLGYISNLCNDALSATFSTRPTEKCMTWYLSDAGITTASLHASNGCHGPVSQMKSGKRKWGAIIHMLEYAQGQFTIVRIHWQHPSSWNHLIFFYSPPAIVQQDRMAYSAPVSSTDFLYSGLSSYVPWLAPLLL